MSFSLLINHTPWIPERVAALRRMLGELADTWAARTYADPWVMVNGPMPYYLHDTDYRDAGALDRADPSNPKPRYVDFTIAQWRWAAKQDVTHHIFMTDDLYFMPRFWDALAAMVDAKPEAIIGLLSNHPKAVELAPTGEHWYRCNSWIVGPCYVVPHVHMLPLLAWAESNGCTGQGWSDDSTLNEWNTFHGPAESWHPVPTIIKHDRGTVSTWAHTGHGDAYSHERVSWEDRDFSIDEMCMKSFWDGSGPMWGLP